MLPTSPPTEADRIALNKMFRALAEYGRKVRLRRQAECEKTGQENPVELVPDLNSQPKRRKRKRARKDGTN